MSSEPIECDRGSPWQPASCFQGYGNLNKTASLWDPQRLDSKSCFYCFECFAGQFVAVNELSDIKLPGTNIQASAGNLHYISAWIIVCNCQDVFNLSLAFCMQKQRHMACKYQLNVTFIRQWINPCVLCPQKPASYTCTHLQTLSNIQFWVSISILPPEVHLWMHYATTSSFILMYVWAYVSCI